MKMRARAITPERAIDLFLLFLFACLILVAIATSGCGDVHTAGEDCCSSTPLAPTAIHPATITPAYRLVSVTVACDTQHGILEVVCNFQLYCTLGNLCTSHATTSIWEWGDGTTTTYHGNEPGVHTYTYPNTLPPNSPVHLTFPIGVTVTDDTGTSANASELVAVDNN